MTQIQTIIQVLILQLFCSALPVRGEPRPERHDGPPPEAYVACEGKERGDSAEFMSPFGDTITGICVEERRRLFLRPDFPPERREEKQRSQEVVTAKPGNSGSSRQYPVVDTGVRKFYGNRSVISTPSRGKRFYGQDAQYRGNQPSYTDNRDGTVTDTVTGLMWQQDMGMKMTWSKGLAKARSSKLAGYRDWRVPTIKELYSLILFTGRHGGRMGGKTLPYLNTKYFKQPLGDQAAGERIIDAQTWSVTEYTGRAMRGREVVFGVNFIDGRIKPIPNMIRAQEE